MCDKCRAEMPHWDENRNAALDAAKDITGYFAASKHGNLPGQTARLVLAGAIMLRAVCPELKVVYPVLYAELLELEHDICKALEATEPAPDATIQ